MPSDLEKKISRINSMLKGLTSPQFVMVEKAIRDAKKNSKPLPKELTVNGKAKGGRAKKMYGGMTKKK